MKPPVALLLASALTIAAPAAEPARELDPEVATRLIADINEVSETPISVVSVIEGSGKPDAGFEVRHMRRVTVIMPVLEGGSRVRRVCRYDFCWSEPYGWFYAEKRQVRGGDQVWIWSETQGEIIVR